MKSCPNQSQLCWKQNGRRQSLFHAVRITVGVGRPHAKYPDADQGPVWIEATGYHTKKIGVD
jgi:hypothetical protein